MIVTYAKIDKILKTLPIGYYLGHNIKVILSKQNESYLNYVDNEIVISAPMIQQALESQTDENKIEQYVRTLLYHEISHTIMTPRQLFENLSDKHKQIINIFEDERIETILKDNFINVDFKDFLFNVTNVDEVIENKDTMSKFYSIVRYRKGEKTFVDLVDKIILTYQYINYDSITFLDFGDYRKQILKLYELIDKHQEIIKQQTKNKENNNNNDDEKSQQKDKNKIDEYDENNENETIFDDDDLITKTLKERNEKLNESIKSLNGYLDCTNSMRKNNILNQTTLKQTLEKIEAKFNIQSINDSIKHQLRKSGLSGNATSSYTGKFNYRLIQNNDYKYFTSVSSNNSYRQYQKFHLNLFIDNSGSFTKNRTIVNRILKNLSNFESENHNFSFDLITINTSIEEHDKKHRWIEKCFGSNALLKEIYNVVRKHQQYQATIYNIVLFDGDACCEPTYEEPIKEQSKNFKAFDHSNFTIISDKSNEKYLKRIKQARIILTSNYTDELIDNISKVIRTI